MIRTLHPVVLFASLYSVAAAGPASPRWTDATTPLQPVSQSLSANLHTDVEALNLPPAPRIQSTTAHSMAAVLRRPIPDHLVVLTFDDAPVTHATFVANILKKYNFGATFFICEFPPNFSDKTKYMSWEQIQDLYRMGFEIGNHTAFHTHVSKMNREQFQDSLAYIEDKCKRLGIPKPVTFAYPGYDANSKDLDVLSQRGYTFARMGGERTYDPLVDDALHVPGIDANGTDEAHVLASIEQAHNGKIVVLTFHGVPDYEHDWVTTPPESFLKYMDFLKVHHYTVIALRDLNQYIDPAQALKVGAESAATK
jgi:peptidoglycan/xylan/chitin deacetylase (PgdA/CDA1 family)